ncbi:MAG: T9SS type A sorting domain-containing protein [Saprospiraceae bacterium]
MKTRIISRFPKWGTNTIPFILSLLVHLLLPFGLQAQIAEWTFENISSSVPSLPISASSQIEGVSAYASLHGGNNNGSPDECFGNESWSTNFWPTSSSPDANEYIEFSVRVTGDEAIGVSGFSFYSSASSSNSARNFTAYYSTDNFSSSNFLITSTHSSGGCYPHNRSLSVIIQPSQTLRVRIHSYGQNPAAQAATIRIDNVRVLGAVLPVSLSAFTATPQKDRIILNWTTATEINNDHFRVERSADGSYFETIGQISGMGTTARQQSYQFADLSPLEGQNYYRLRQIDHDGKEQVHPVAPVYYEGPGASGFSIWPTVVTQELQVQLSVPAPAGQLQILDLNGRMIRQIAVESTEGNRSLAVNDLPAGAYLLRYTTPQFFLVKRFFKQ